MNGGRVMVGTTIIASFCNSVIDLRHGILICKLVILLHQKNALQYCLGVFGTSSFAESINIGVGHIWPPFFCQIILLVAIL